MKIQVKPGQGVMIATHVGKGDDRRALFIAPWGCSLNAPQMPPSGADTSTREYEVEVTGDCGRLITAALKDGHPGLSGRVEILGTKKP